jgi:hypothetical protein
VTPSPVLDDDAVLLSLELYTEPPTIAMQTPAYFLLIFLILFLYTGFYVRDFLKNPEMLSCT